MIGSIYRITIAFFALLFIACNATTTEEPPVASSNSDEEELPTALREGIKIEKFAVPQRGCVRINYDPTTESFLYNTMRGDIYQVSPDGKSEELIATAEDHGITTLQGFRLYQDLMFLVGNIDSNGDKGTKGKIVRGTRQPDGNYTFELLAITEDYGRTATIYSHEFNGIAVDLAGEYIYVNSGARTDHGELQDNEGAYPGAREVPLTACIFRLPADGKDILLKNDSIDLAANGYLFSDGVRNAYDLTFSPEGKLFGVSNSSDYDHPEEMNWFREGRHYGYPWEMGGIQNPQQFPDWDPDPEKDPFINTMALAHRGKQFRNDPEFPPKPANVELVPPIQNLGPDANIYRDRETGLIMDADTTGATVGTFTPHRSPLGLFFDRDSVLADPYRGDAFVLSWSDGKTQPLMRPFSPLGADLIHLELTYDAAIDNYALRSYRIVGDFRGPTDAVQVGEHIYVIENRGSIWKITMPSGTPLASR
ncbi:MAG: cytochrome c class I [Cyclobacteriaceae bacterium]